MIRLAKYLSLFLTFFFFSHPLWAETNEKTDLDIQRDTFIRAEHAFKKHDLLTYQRLAQKITTYPLYPYLLYEELKRKIQTNQPTNVTLDELNAFGKAYPDFPFLTSLRNSWLDKLAKQKHWSTFIQGYQPSQNVALTCLYHYGKYQLSQDKHLLHSARPLWLVGTSQPNECNALFAAWKENGGLTTTLIWERLKLALEKKNFKLSQYLIKLLPQKEQSVALEWEKMVKNPLLLNKEKDLQKLGSPSYIQTEILTTVIHLLAKIDAEKAATWWKNKQTDYPFTINQQHQIQRNIAQGLCSQKNPLAKTWLANLPNDTLDATLHEWRCRLALKENDWENALKWLNALPPELKHEKIWRYWRARALSALGQTEAANAIYHALAKSRSYYGFLASIHLRQPISMQNQPLKLDPTIAAKVNSLPAIQRFEELRKVGKPELARIEWFRALDKMHEPEIIALAKIAQNMKLNDIAILTIAKSQQRDDISLRFPLTYQTEILNAAKEYQLDPAWISAIARQESAFYNEALSPVGARGIMQLMPATAKIMAKQYHVPYTSENLLHHPKTNITLGSAYLKDLKRMTQNHPIITTASYNAGPTRALKWLPNEKMDPDIWIEILPFKETREYVKNVLTYLCIYQQQLGQPITLPEIMKPITAKKAVRDQTK